MDGLWVLALLSGFHPLSLAWRRTCGTTLRAPLAWAGLAWIAWLAAACADALSGSGSPGLHYLATCLTACAGVAVLGARRPGVGAWNFVVVGLLVLLLRPVAEGLGTLRLESPHLIFLAVVLAVGTLNYLPTSNGPAALTLGTGWLLELAPLAGLSLPSWAMLLGRFALALSPWLALLASRLRPRPTSEVDALWLAFRDGYGLVWGQRAREQFNRAADNAGWPIRLGWGGFQGQVEGSVPGVKVLALMRGVLRRFGPPADPQVPA